MHDLASKYFQLLQYPLTNVESWQWQWQGREALSLTMPADHRAFRERQTRFLLAERKYRRALKIARWFSRVPFVKLIMVSGSVALNHASDDSDIDFFVVTTPRRLWLVRFLTVSFVKILGLRPTPSNKRDTICLSAYTDEDHLNWQSLALQPEDPCFVYWLAQMVPLYDAGDYYARFWQANRWLQHHVPTARPVITHEARQLTSKTRTCKRCLEKLFAGGFGDFLEERLKAFQLSIMPAKIRELMNLDTRVVVTDHLLKFHTTDRRAEILAKLKAM